MLRLGEWILKWRFWLSLLIGLVTLLALTQLPKLRTEDDENTWFTQQDPVLATFKRFRENFPHTGNVIVAYRCSTPLDSAELIYLNQLGGKLQAAPFVTQVLSLLTVEDIVGSPEGLSVEPLIGQTNLTESDRLMIQQRITRNPFISGNLLAHHGEVLALLLEIDLPEDSTQTNVARYIELSRTLKTLLDTETRRTGRQFHFSGEQILDGELNAIIEHDIAVFFPLSLLISGAVVFLLFRNWRVVVTALATVVVALLWTLGLKGFADIPISPVSSTLFALINIIGLANSIHLISQFRIEMTRHTERRGAILQALVKAGRPCFFTSFTTAVGFGSLAISRIPAIKNLGLFAGFGIMVAYLLALILVPTLLMSTHLNLTGKKQSNMTSMQKVLDRIANWNLRFPRLILLSATVLTVLMAMGLPRIQTEASMLEYLKKSNRLYQDTRFLDQWLTGASSLEIVLSGAEDTFKEPAVLRQIDSIQQALAPDPAVAATYSVVDYLKLINRALNADHPEAYRIPDSRSAVAQAFLLYEISGGEETADFVTADYATARLSIRTRQMNANLRQGLLNRIEHLMRKYAPDIKYEVTGVDFLVNAVTHQIIRTQIESLAMALIVILALMIAQFGWRGGLISVLPNIFPIVMTLGLMGYGNFHLNMATAIIASIAIGMVVDDTIHYFSHFKTDFVVSGARQVAMRSALLEVGPALIFTSGVLVLGFAVNLLSQTRILRDFGILSGVAIVTALLGDLFIGPVLLSRWEVFRRRK